MEGVGGFEGTVVLGIYGGCFKCVVVGRDGLFLDV